MSGILIVEDAANICEITLKDCVNRENGCENCSVNYIYENIEYLASLHEQGRLITLPCKVGDTVWGYWMNDGVIMLEELYITNEQQALFMKDLWGKKVFATPKEAQEEAEAKLAEMESK